MCLDLVAARTSVKWDKSHVEVKQGESTRVRQSFTSSFLSENSNKLLFYKFDGI